jgi:exopolyphosphatase/guanosine-5'-triphosphate,3'-diphosphate pyrophosphatase
MAKRTAIIDIGSNSARLVIYEKTSRYGFHLICERKSKVRIGEGAYEKGGYLQPPAIKRAYLALASFKQTADKYNVRKMLCVATSALRDAPNGPDFVRYIKKHLGLHIRIIDGDKEATYGAIAVNNLLPPADTVTVDIGGGSTDMALIKNGEIVQTCSLNLGTVRLKELFFDKECPREKAYEDAAAYVRDALQSVPDSFRCACVTAIGGTARALSRAVMKRRDYPFDKLHAFRYDVEKEMKFFEKIARSSAKGLKRFPIKKSRYDTIREGTLIWHMLLKHLDTECVVTSSVGVREGVFLEQFLRNDKLRFPRDVNPSVVSLLDRFKPYVDLESKKRRKLRIATELYRTLQCEIDDAMRYETHLRYALRLSNIGKTLTIYKAHQHAFYIAMQELNYRFTHEDMLLIALLLRMHGKELLHQPLFKGFKKLLPDEKHLSWLSFIYTLSIYLHEASDDADIAFSYENKVLTITADSSLYLAKEKIKRLEKPEAFAVIIKDTPRIPRDTILRV